MFKWIIGFLFIASAYAAPTISCTPTRTTGVAPLFVLIDCSGTTDGSVSYPFHDDHYETSFGDYTGSLWGYGTNTNASKNFATGPISAHVFETAGTFTITSNACNASGCSSTTNSVTVTDPDSYYSTTNSICIGASATPTAGSGGCPASAAVHQVADGCSAINSYQATGKRILFKKGDTFTCGSHGRITAAGPGTLGAFGTGAKPIIQMTGNDTILFVSSSTTPTIKDWRIIDIELDGLGVTSGNINSAIGADGTIKQLTLLRMNIHDTQRGVAGTISILDWWNTHSATGHTLYEEWAIVDSIISGHTGCNADGASSPCDWRLFLAGIHNAVLGSSLDGLSTGGSHVMRSSFLQKSVISNSTIAHSNSGQEAFKNHAPTWSGGAKPATDTMSPTDGKTEYNVISSNKFIGSGGPWTYAIGPQDSASDEPVNDEIIENNWFVAGSGSAYHIHNAGYSNITLRNNIFDLSGGSGFVGIQTDKWSGSSGQSSPTNSRIYNNTFYSSTAAGFNPILIGSGATSTIAKNNLGYAPNSTSRTMISDSGTGTTGASGTYGNTSNAAVLTNPSFDGTTNPVDFRVSTGSYATTAGVDIYPVRTHDFFNCTDKNGNYRSGAFVPKSYARCRGGK